MLDDLTGKIALVTGASRGIGRAVALALAEAGADLAVNYLGREAQALDTVKTIERLGGRAITLQADVSIAADVSRPGPAGRRANRAGSCPGQQRRHHPPAAHPRDHRPDWDEVLAVNLKSVFPVTQAAAAEMRAHPLGSDYQPLLGRGSDRRDHRPALCRLEGRASSASRTPTPPRLPRGDHGQLHRPGPGRDGHGDRYNPRALPDLIPGEALRNGGGGGRGGGACWPATATSPARPSTSTAAGT